MNGWIIYCIPILPVAYFCARWTWRNGQDVDMPSGLCWALFIGLCGGAYWPIAAMVILGVIGHKANEKHNFATLIGNAMFGRNK